MLLNIRMNGLGVLQCWLFYPRTESLLKRGWGERLQWKFYGSVWGLFLKTILCFLKIKNNFLTRRTYLTNFWYKTVSWKICFENGLFLKINFKCFKLFFFEVFLAIWRILRSLLYRTISGEYIYIYIFACLNKILIQIFLLYLASGKLEGKKRQRKYRWLLESWRENKAKENIDERWKVKKK